VVELLRKAELAVVVAAGVLLLLGLAAAGVTRLREQRGRKAREEPEDPGD
jgi:CHASE1-domain containing sensor protein